MTEEILLQPGDVIILELGMTVYATLPQHFLYGNRRGCWTLAHGQVSIAGETGFLAGRYIVTHAETGGGGKAIDGPFPDGHHVFCIKADNPEIKVDFYQTGCFTAMLPNIRPVGRATMTWTVQEEE